MAQLPCTAQGGQLGRTVLIRTDGAGGTHKLLEFLTTQHLSYSVGFGLSKTLTAAMRCTVERLRPEILARIRGLPAVA